MNQVPLVRSGETWVMLSRTLPVASLIASLSVSAGPVCLRAQSFGSPEAGSRLRAQITCSAGTSTRNTR